MSNRISCWGSLTSCLWIGKRTLWHIRIRDSGPALHTWSISELGQCNMSLSPCALLLNPNHKTWPTNPIFAEHNGGVTLDHTHALYNGNGSRLIGIQLVVNDRIPNCPCDCMWILLLTKIPVSTDLNLRRSCPMDVITQCEIKNPQGSTCIGNGIH